MISPSNDNQRREISGEGFTLKTLRIAEAAKIDGLKLIATGQGPILLFSRQACRSPRLGFGDCQMEIKSVLVSAPDHVTQVASLPRLLPPPPRWDAVVAASGGYEILFEEAGGALYRLLLRDALGTVVSPSAAYPLQSFAQPRFLRAESGRAASSVSAILDDKSLVIFPGVGASQPAKYAVLAESADGVVGQAGDLWAVTKTTVGGVSVFNELPGRLTLLRFARADAVSSTTPFPGFLAYELDATALGTDVVVFATGEPAVLLLASHPERPIALMDSERRALRQLSRPTIATWGERVYVAAIANPGTDDAHILYGEFPVKALRNP